MSLQALEGTTTQSAPAAPVVDQALEPASVRHGSAATQKAYQSALAFEQVLVEQLAKSLSVGIGGEEEGESGGAGSDAAASQLSSTIPQSLAASVMSAGGLGMAAQMTQQMQALAPSSAPSVSPASGGTPSSALPTNAPLTAVTSPSSGGTGA